MGETDPYLDFCFLGKPGPAKDPAQVLSSPLAKNTTINAKVLQPLVATEIKTIQTNAFWSQERKFVFGYKKLGYRQGNGLIQEIFISPKRKNFYLALWSSSLSMGNVPRKIPVMNKDFVQ